MTIFSDEQLMILIVEQDDLKAFEELIVRYEKPLLTYIFRYISDVHIVQDLFQETFYRIFKHRKLFKPKLRFSTWAYRIATNLCINEINKKRHEWEVFLEDINRKGETLWQSQNSKTNKVPSYPSAEERLIRKDMEERIGNLIQSLPEKLKAVFILSEYQEFTYREIAEVLEISLGTVHSRLHDSFKYLYDLIEKKGLINELQ